MTNLLQALAWALGCGAAAAAVLGLLGRLSNWLDAFNHFRLVWIGAAVCSAVLGGLSLAGGWPILLALAGLAALLSAVPVVHEAMAAASETSASGDAPVLTVVTFNVFHGRLTDARTEAVMRRSGADLICLQECEGTERIREALRDLYPHQLLGDAPDHMSAILSRRPFLSSGAAPQPEHGRTGLIWATVEAPDGAPATVANAHLVWPIRRGWREAHRRLAGLAPGFEPDAVLVGDFNLTPWSFTLGRLDRALAPLSRRTHGVLSWPSSRLIPPFLPLDQAYAAPGWRTVRVRRLPHGGSDHYPVAVELSRTPSSPGLAPGRTLAEESPRSPAASPGRWAGP